MQKSESIANLLEAISTVQEAVPSITKKETNTYFSSKYATLDDVWEKIKVPMKEAGLFWIALPTNEGLWYRLEWHGDSTDLDSRPDPEFIEGTMPLTNDGNPQHLGSSLTYARRYSLVTVFNLMLNEDDDGNSARPSVKCCKCNSTDTRKFNVQGNDYWCCPEHAPNV